MRHAAPGESVIGPAVSGFDFPFLEQCFKAGLLEYWSAVSVHPYRQTDPETVVEDYCRLRRLIDAYAPAGKRVPIISGEWGYTSAWHNLDEAWQAKMYARELLINQANGITLSIWYDWHDDGQDSKDIEHHWGTVSFPYYSNREPVYDPKPAYRAAQTLSKLLDGYRFSERLPVGGGDDYVLVFTKGDTVRVAAWSTSPSGQNVKIQLKPGTYRLIAHTGEMIGVRTVDGSQLDIKLTDAPQYLVSEK
jgi:hypothetical protein